jgi:hypothetical protein
MMGLQPLENLFEYIDEINKSILDALFKEVKNENE